MGETNKENFTHKSQKEKGIKIGVYPFIFVLNHNFPIELHWHKTRNQKSDFITHNIENHWV